MSGPPDSPVIEVYMKMNLYDTVDGRNPANHLGCKKKLEIIGYLPYQPVSRISEPSTVSLLLYTFAYICVINKRIKLVMLNLGILV